MGEQPVAAPQRLLLADLNSHLVCVLCRGYLIDATTIVECLHSFCRSCLVRHLEKVTTCPSCEAPLPKARPFLHIKSDKTLQDIVYKLVPGLYSAEMQRRRHFFAQHPEQATLASAEERGEAMERLVFSPEDHFSLSLEYFDPQSEKETVLRTAEDWEIASSRSSESGHESNVTTAEGGATLAGPAKRYLQCPALFTVRLLKKFLRIKFDLDTRHRIDVIHRRVCLPDDYTLMDVAYIYSWRQSAPMRFLYRIYSDTDQIQTSSKKTQTASEPVSDEHPPPTKLSRTEEKSMDALIVPPKEVTVTVHLSAVTESVEMEPSPKMKSPQPSPILPLPIVKELQKANENKDEQTKLPVAHSENKIEVPPVSAIISEAPKVVSSDLQLLCSETMPVKIAQEEKTTEFPSQAPTSPNKQGARPRPIGASRGGQSAPSILTIAQTLARKQQARQQQEQSSLEVTQVVQHIIKQTSAQTDKPSAATKVKENTDKFKPIQPKLPTAMPCAVAAVARDGDQANNTPATTTVLSQHVPPLQQQAQKRPHSAKKPLYQVMNGNKEPIKQQVRAETIKLEQIKDGIKKPKIHEDILRHTLSKSQSKSPPKQLSSARTRPSPTYNMNASLSPFAPMHRPHPHPIRIPAPPKQQRPSSLSSSSSPSPSPPADISPCSSGGRAHAHLQGEAASQGRGLYPTSGQSNGAAAAAAAILMQQQLELQSRFLHGHAAPRPHLALHHHHPFLQPSDWFASAESMKRLEGLMRSLGHGATHNMFPYRPTMPSPAAAAAAAHAAAAHAASVAHAQSSAK